MRSISLVKARTRADRKTIVLLESTDRKTWRVAETVLKEDTVNLIIIGTPEDIADCSKELDVSGATMINPQTYEKTQEYIGLFVELRKSKGITPEKAREITMSDYAHHGCLTIRSGNAGGLVSGACHSTADTLRPCPQVVKTKPGTELVPAFFLMVVPGCEYGADGTFIFASSGLNQNPNPEELTVIVKSSADSSELLVQKEARVAMLSHSTRGSAKHPDVDEVVEAIRIAKESYPELKLDGELQLGAALILEVAPSGALGGEAIGKANVLMFPDLDVGSIGCKLIQRLAKAETCGPATQRIAKPVDDLLRGCCADDVVGVVVITTVQAQAGQAGIGEEIPMNILVINCRSSSLKYQLIDSASEAVLAKGPCERIGIEGSQITYQPAGEEREVTVSPMPTHTQAIQIVLDALTNDKTGMIKSLDKVGAAGYRIVHEGEAFTASTLITEGVVKAIEECSDLVPLHNPANLVGIRACQELIPSTPMAGVFDTAFHQIMPGRACLYGLSYEYYEKHKVKRYCFHGTSHDYMPKKMAGTLECPYDFLRTVVCHLSNGSSISVVFNGKPVDTSMGLTPLEGPVTGTRSDDVDPGAPQFIVHKENIDIGQILNVPNKKSGVYGMSGVSNDFRDAKNIANEGNKRMEAAPESFIYRVAKYMGTCTAAMNGVDAIAFTADVGGNDKITRRKVRGYPVSLGIEIDNEANSKRGQEIVISASSPKASVLVIPTNEELAIAGETSALAK